MLIEKSSCKHCNPSVSAVFRTAIKGNWIITFKLSGRYCPYYYIFCNNKDVMIINSTEEYEAYCDINNIEFLKT